MKRFKVEVIRLTQEKATYEIEAESLAQAHDLANQGNGFPEYKSQVMMVEHRVASAFEIDKALDAQYLHDRIHLSMTLELERQKAAGKKFITDEEVDALVEKVLRDELKK